MRLLVAALLGLTIPGTGHLVAGRGRRFAVVFVVPIVALGGLVALALAQGGVYGLAALVVTPGVLPALALLNVAIAAWRIASGADAARRVEASRRATAVVAVATAVLVIAPHVLVGRAISSTSELLDSLFASGPAVVEDEPWGEEPPGTPDGSPFNAWITALSIPTDEPDPTPGEVAAATQVATPRPTATPVPRGPYTGGGGGNLPPLGAAVPWPAPGAAPWGSDGRFSLLLLGSDAGSDRWSRRMDVMLLVEVDVATGETAMVGFPRNLENAPLPPGPARNAVACGCLQGLLNELYVEATVRHPDRWPGTGAIKGIGAVRAVISELSGRPIDAVLVTDLMGVVRVVDAMGGIDIDVPSPVYDTDYPDPILGDIRLSIRAGQQHFDGRLALAYARSRHQDSDYARMARQQTLLLAIRSQLGAATILRAPDLVTAAKGAAWTDLPRDSLPNLVTLFGRAANARIHQLRIVPPAYPEWLTPTVISKIRRDIAALLPPVPTATPTPAPTASPTSAPSSSPIGSPPASASPSSSSSLPPTSSPVPSPSPSATPTPTAAPSTSPTATPTPAPTAS